MFLAFAFLVLAAVVAVGIRERVWDNPRRYLSVSALLVGMLVLVVHARQATIDADGSDAPVLLAISADVSLSMGTIPEPATHGETGTRLERAQAVLLPLLANLASAARPAMVAVSAFTARAETILAWDDDLSLAEEIVEFVLTTGLLTEAGSDLGGALAGVVPLFESLPEAYRGEGHPKYLLLVSDGEQTASGEPAEPALAKLAELGVRVIALHVGRTDVEEGLPVYDESGEFLGFEEVSGQIFSTPNPEIMRSLAGGDGGAGLFVQVADRDAVGTIIDFIGLKTGEGRIDGTRLAAILMLWAGLLFLLLRRL
ncbi:MAG: VWA domain-containing protein [Woeseiaceae bacterium]|nr:VWA domain-containing protein [Woeseiaceae bacterium]